MDTRLIPAYAAVASLVLLLAHASSHLLSKARIKSSEDTPIAQVLSPETNEPSPPTMPPNIRSLIEQLGVTNFVLRSVQMLSCLSLVVISAIALVLKSNGASRESPSSDLDWVEVVQVLYYVSAVGFLSIFPPY